MSFPLPSRLCSSPLLSTFLSFGAIQAAQILLPLLALPWLARVLGTSAFGLLMYMSVVSAAVGLIMDWGFSLGAVREAAVSRGRERALIRILGQVLSAKMLLAGGCVLLALALLPFLAHVASYPGAFALAVLGGMVRGLNPTWFFQGTGRGMRRMAWWDVCSSAVVLALMFIAVRSPEDWPRYLGLLVIIKGSTYAYLTMQIVHRGPAVSFSLCEGWRALGATKILFISVLSTLLYCNGVQLILGTFLSPAHMGMLAASDKIVRAVVSLGSPLTQTLFPEICVLRNTKPMRASSLLRRSLLWTAAVMLCASAALWLAAPFVIEFALGKTYAEAVPIFRRMLFVIPVLACNFVLGTQILVPYGHEKMLTLTQIMAGVFSLPAAALIGSHWGVMGGAYIPLWVEGSIFLGLGLGVFRMCPSVLFPSPTQFPE